MRDPRDCFQKCLLLSRSLSNDRQTDRQTETNKRTRNDHHPRDDDLRERSTRDRERKREVKLCARKRFSLLSLAIKSQFIFRVLNPSRLKGFLLFIFPSFLRARERSKRTRNARRDACFAHKKRQHERYFLPFIGRECKRDLKKRLF